MEPLVVQGVDVLGREVGGDHRGGQVEGAVLWWVRVPVSVGSQSGRRNPQSQTASSIIVPLSILLSSGSRKNRSGLSRPFGLGSSSISTDTSKGASMPVKRNVTTSI